MAEGALTCLVSRVVAVIRSEAFMTAWGDKEDLIFLKVTVETINNVLFNVSKHELDSVAVRGWIERLRDVMFEADDLFDLVASEAMLMQQTMENKHGQEITDFLSKLNPVISKEVKRLKTVMKYLQVLCKDVARLPCKQPRTGYEISVLKPGQTHVFVDRKIVIGREDDKNAVLGLLLNERHDGQSVSVVAIDGLLGVGKTSLAQLVYDDEKVCKNFESRWWVSVSGISDGKEFLARILESISMYEDCDLFTLDKLQSEILLSTRRAGKFLLVLDDVFEMPSSVRLMIMTLLSSGEAGSRIFLTIASMLPVFALRLKPEQVYVLSGLGVTESWELFKIFALQTHEECTPDHVRLGGQITAQCNGVPLAIKSIACFLSRCTRIRDWEFCAGEMVLLDGNIMPEIRLSYDHLPSALKQCLAYCSLFPSHYVFRKEELTYLWTGQGFVIPMLDLFPFEVTVYDYLKDLFGGLFFQGATLDENGDVLSWTMNSTMHRFAKIVAGEEIIMLTRRYNQNLKKIRHVSVGYEVDGSWEIPPSLYDMDRPPLRSFLFLYKGSLSPVALNEVLNKFKLLRALNLQHQKIGVVPNSIGDLIHLRCLNLSHNKFPILPDSITKLVNLLTLDISCCRQLELLPVKFSRLCNLRHLDTKGCYSLRHMPPGFEELTSLQWLGMFKVGKVMDASISKPDVLAVMELKEELEIKFDEDTKWRENECLHLPLYLKVLTISYYPGMRLSFLKTLSVSSVPSLASLHIGRSSKVQDLSLFRGLPYLKSLQLIYLEQLEYIEIDGGEMAENALFFPCLMVLKLEGLPKLKGWSRRVEAAFRSHGRVADFLPVLSDLTVRCCQELKFMPLCPVLKTLELNEVNNGLIQHLLSPTSDAFFSSVPSSLLETVAIWGCDLPNFPLETLASLRCLRLSHCYELEKLSLLTLELHNLKELVIDNCLELELWGENNRGLNWDLLPQLSTLTLIGMLNPERLPDSLLRRQANGTLFIKMD